MREFGGRLTGAFRARTSRTSLTTKIEKEKDVIKKVLICKGAVMSDLCTKRVGATRRSLLALCAAFAGGVMILLAAPAAAGPVVDRSTLQPQPPPGAVCRADGLWTICQTTFLVDMINEPIPFLDLPCGTVYETISDLREGIRWYLDGKLVKRFVSQNADGTWSLSPTGAGPAVKISLHASWRDEYVVPGDESSALTTFHGSGFTASAPGAGVIAHIAGLDLPDGTHRGVFRIVEDAESAANLCDALTA